MSNRLEALRVFCAAADAANFRDAAVRLSVSPQVVTRAVRELEDELGEPLFHRSTRGVQLTDFGRQLAERARVAVGGVDELFHRTDRRALSQHEGTVRVTAPGIFGRRLIPQALAPMLAAHPGLLLDLRVSEEHADMVDQQIDIGVRVGPLRDARFVARPVGKMALHVVAAPSLIARTGLPKNIDALAGMPLTALIDRMSGRPWPMIFSKGRQLAVTSPAFVTDDFDAEGAAVLAGLGFAQLIGSLAEPGLASGALVPVLEADAPEPWPIYVYRAQRAPVPARVRLVYDELIRVLR
ncbi:MULTISPECIES: LysR family transcriptional regulator [Variovorax]|jgi:DNA-binding transcriptional LysR family regulator|uniref:LysR family transcriptional regulator n=1 Tax=Variovorax TaxID=34072 RepID=UPI00086CBC02|nr:MULTISPECIES: LysR family transcriptional regulator [Variovorax]MBN8757957.1 LysR family transcriptional regulator [Variovorax sp.]ODU13390.1 MAG: LysR family transcriptional regulator [Variovorax sp. SCN 67-85]ODV23055.1 MAG: LysR family transcriptional regulator [Variovorax sp. SCN 67-20]OJZ12932.1 MAG: LysR family transcriptional regulator [Variovorax sp. 67-131]UKI09518.1 LysR family transcriptional regulator [Variovorax paradoxus]